MRGGRRRGASAPSLVRRAKHPGRRVEGRMTVIQLVALVCLPFVWMMLANGPSRGAMRRMRRNARRGGVPEDVAFDRWVRKNVRVPAATSSFKAPIEENCTKISDTTASPRSGVAGTIKTQEFSGDDRKKTISSKPQPKKIDENTTKPKASSRDRYVAYTLVVSVFAEIQDAIFRGETIEAEIMRIKTDRYPKWIEQRGQYVAELAILMLESCSKSSFASRENLNRDTWGRF